MKDDKISPWIAVLCCAIFGAAIGIPFGIALGLYLWDWQAGVVGFVGCTIAAIIPGGDLQ